MCCCLYSNNKKGTTHTRRDPVACVVSSKEERLKIVLITQLRRVECETTCFEVVEVRQLPRRKLFGNAYDMSNSVSRKKVHWSRGIWPIHSNLLCRKWWAKTNSLGVEVVECWPTFMQLSCKLAMSEVGSQNNFLGSRECKWANFHGSCSETHMSESVSRISFH